MKHWLAFSGCWIYLPILQMRMEIMHLKEKLYNLVFGCLKCLCCMFIKGSVTCFRKTEELCVLEVLWLFSIISEYQGTMRSPTD